MTLPHMSIPPFYRSNHQPSKLSRTGYCWLNGKWAELSVFSTLTTENLSPLSLPSSVHQEVSSIDGQLPLHLLKMAMLSVFTTPSSILHELCRQCQNCHQIGGTNSSSLLHTSMQITVKSVHNITPYKAYHKQKPDISHLCKIGCCAFVLILNKHNLKIFQRSEEHVLIGYGKDSKMYCCYHRPTHKVIESYHVTFIESKDECQVPFWPGVTQGLDDKSNQTEITPIPPSTLNHNTDKPPIGMDTYQTIFTLFSQLLTRHVKLCSLNQTFVAARTQSWHPEKLGHMSFHIKILGSAHQGKTWVPLWYQRMAQGTRNGRDVMHGYIWYQEVWF